MTRLIYISILVAATALIGSSCVKESQPMPSTQGHVLLVYVGTDNNLSGYEQQKLDGLRTGSARRPNDHVIAYIDSDGGDARLIEISNLAPGEQPRRIATYGAENSASADVFARVVWDVRAMYPNAQSRGLLVFSHASGWLPEGAFINPYPGTPGSGTPDPGTPGGVIFTVNNTLSGVPEPGVPEPGVPGSGVPGPGRSLMQDRADEMTLRDFAHTIPDHEFDYIVFEMCFMAGIEVAYELRHKTNYILASSAEIVHPGFAPIYATNTTKLLSANLQGFAQSAFANVLTYAPESVQHSATYSVIRTAEMEPLALFIRDNCDFSTIVNSADVQHFDRNEYRLFFDFEDYHARLMSSEMQSVLRQLLARTVIWKQATPEFMTQQAGYNGFTINRFSGITNYIPQPQYPSINQAYTELEWYRDTNRIL